MKAHHSIFPLGELEADVMGIVWSSAAPVTVRDVYTELRSRGPIAQTTCGTVMQNLTRKAWLGCDRSQATFRYAPRVSRQEAVDESLDAVLHKLCSGDVRPMVRYCVQLTRGAA